MVQLLQAAQKTAGAENARHLASRLAKLPVRLPIRNARDNFINTDMGAAKPFLFNLIQDKEQYG